MRVPQHGISLARGGLTIHEDGAVASFATKLTDDLLAALLVYFIVGVGRSESIIIGELVTVGLLDSRHRSLLLRLGGSGEGKKGLVIDVFTGIPEGLGEHGIVERGDGAEFGLDVPDLFIFKQMEEGAHANGDFDVASGLFLFGLEHLTNDYNKEQILYLMQIFTSEHYQPLLKLCSLPFNQPFNLTKLPQFIFVKTTYKKQYLCQFLIDLFGLRSSKHHLMLSNSQPDAPAVLIRQKRGHHYQYKALQVPGNPSRPIRRVFIGYQQPKTADSKLGFLEGQEHWGNHQRGQQWVREMKERNRFGLFYNYFHRPGVYYPYSNQQITFIEPSPAAAKIKDLKMAKKPFVDDRFPPNLTSLVGEYGPQKGWEEVTWVKATERFSNPKIFQGKIEPLDIKQGILQDCYLLASLAALAERPDRIYNLFLEKEINESKYFSVRMIFKGKWVVVDMDEYIPYLEREGRAAFTRANQNELWVILLQKAWAKLYSSYKRIDIGTPEEALHDLTGAPVQYIFFENPNIDRQVVWNYLLEASRLEYAMVASSMPGSDTTTSFTGIVQGHAYTLLNATYLKVKNQSERVVQLRNPWGRLEFRGRWSDGDQSWNQVDEAEKQRVGYFPNEQDGIFFMPYEQFLSQFTMLAIAEIEDDASYVYKSYKDPECKGAYFAVEVPIAGTYSLCVAKTPARFYPKEIQQKFEYPEAFLDLSYMEGGNCTRITGRKSNWRTLYKKQALLQGTYIIGVKINYDRKLEQQFDANLAVYGPHFCKIRLATRAEAQASEGTEDVEWDGIERTSEEESWNSQGNLDYDSAHYRGYRGFWNQPAYKNRM